MLTQAYQDVTENGPGISTAACSCLTPDALPVISSSFSQSETPEHGRIRSKPPLSYSNRLSPLSGKKIFMHYDPGTLPDKHVEAILVKLKADVVDFFSREVHYVITSRTLSRLPGNSTQLTSRPEELGSLNPGSGHPPDSNKTSASSLKRMPSALTRGRAMLMAAQKVSPTATTVHASPPESNPLSFFHHNRLAHASGRRSTPTNTGLPSVKETVAMASPSDLLVRARHLGIRILTLDSVLRWIRNLPSDVQAYIQSSEQHDVDENFPTTPDDPERDRISQVRHLTAPCIKIVDLTNQFRPLYLDRTDFLPNLWSTFSYLVQISDATLVERIPSQTACGSGTLPGASIGLACPQHPSHPMTRMRSVLTRRRNHSKKSELTVKKPGTTKNPPILRRTVSIPVKLACTADRSKAVVEEPSGYCECCSLSFPNLLEHLKSMEHQQFVCNTENYRSLDWILSQLPSVKTFLISDSLRKRRSCATRRKKRHQHSLDKFSDMIFAQDFQSNVGQPLATVSPTANHTLPSSASVNAPSVVTAEACYSNCPPCLQLPEPPAILPCAGIRDPVQLFSDEEEEIGLIRKSLLDVGQPNLVPPSTPTAVLDQTVSTESHSVFNQPTVVVSSADTGESPNSPVLLPGSRNEMIDLDLNDTLLSPTFDPEVAHAWHSVCSGVYIGKLLKNTHSDIPDNKSPLLEQFHRPCSICHRLHIPTSLSPSFCLQLHSLLGPRYELDGVGCSGKQSPLPHGTPTFSASSVHPSETDSQTVQSRVIPNDCRLFNSASSPCSSPVFGTNTSELCVLQDATPPTLPMDQDTSSLEGVEADCISRDDGARDNLLLTHWDAVGQVACDDTGPVAKALKKSSESLLSTSLRLSEPDSPGSCSPSVRSETTPIRGSLSWLFNNQSFDAKLPPTDKSSESSISLPATPTDSKVANRTRAHWCSDGISVVGLPLLKRRKQSSPSTLVSQPLARTSPFHKKHEKYRNRKRHRHGTFVSSSVPRLSPPQRSPRLAAKIARESINLSVRTFFYPSTMDAFSSSPDSVCAPSLSPLKQIAINSSCKSHPKPGNSTHRFPPQVRPRKKHRRSTLFPTSALPTLDMKKNLTR